MQKTSTFLMFVGEQCGKAEEAINFYVSLFDDSSVLAIERWPDSDLVQFCEFTLAGQHYLASENTVNHQFTFTPAISIWVNCESEEEIDTLFNTLGDGGQPLMPLDNYGIGQKFGWVADRYGITWQLTLP